MKYRSHIALGILHRGSFQLKKRIKNTITCASQSTKIRIRKCSIWANCHALTHIKEPSRFTDYACGNISTLSASLWTCFEIISHIKKNSKVTFTHTSENRGKCPKRTSRKALVFVKKPSTFTFKTCCKVSTLSTASCTVFVKFILTIKKSYHDKHDQQRT